MWESFRNAAAHWSIIRQGLEIGYVSTNEESGLLQFYLLPPWMDERVPVLRQFLAEEAITQGMVCTNNPVFLGAALEAMRSIEVDSYLFTDVHIVSPEERTGLFRAATPAEISRVVKFYQYSIGAPEGWLRGYLGRHVQRGEIFSLEKEGTMLGACEVRKSDSNPQVADIGMVVSPDFRRQGYGTFLLSKAKEVAKGWGRQPICSCEKDNIGSLKSIRKNGFRSFHQVLSVKF